MRDRSVLRRRSFLIGGGLIVAGMASYLRVPKATAQPMTAESFQAAVPGRVGGWTSRKSSEVVLPAQDDANELYENLETRIYEGPGLPLMMVVIAFSSTQQADIQVHRPEVCYPAAGLPVIWSKPLDIKFKSTSIAAREVLADRGGLRERVVYWVRVGDAFPITWPEQRLTMALDNLKGTVPDGVLFRISSIEEPDGDTKASIMTFITAFLDAASPDFRDRILL